MKKKLVVKTLALLLTSVMVMETPMQSFAAEAPDTVVASEETSAEDAPAESEEAPAEESIGVNPYLWQAALTKLSFMPLASADSAGGVIITDWAAMDNIQNEQFKITVNILSRNLRADCLKVAVFKRVLRDGKWVNDTADRRLAGEIENAILTQARKLYRRDLAAREE